MRTNAPSGQYSFDIGRELQRAIQYHRAGHLQLAQQIYESILEANPNHPEALHLLAIIAMQVGKNDMAVDLINRAVQNDPNNPIYYEDLAGAYSNMANTLRDQGQLDEAISFFQKALQSNPGYAEAYSNMGNVFKDLGKLDKAISCCQKALQLKPDLAGAYNNKGNALEDQGKLNEAIRCYKKALELDPGYAEAYNNMGNALEEQGKLNKAIHCYEKALQLKPDLAETSSYLHHQLQRVCAWQKLAGLTSKLDDLTTKALDKGAKPAEAPFVNVTRYADPSLNLAVARSWSSDIARRASNLKIPFSFHDRTSPNMKITLGYLSNDFRNHATAHLMLSLFGLHNRDEFEIYCYSYGPDDRSYHRTRIRRDCDKFVELRNLSHADAARSVYENKVDILVDLKGYTKGNRLDICALRPAPVQATYLGFPGTTGADFFDYIITDRIVTPEDHAPYYSENFAYLPHCYQVNDHTQAISNKNWRKVDFALPEDTLVFSSFNEGYKIDPIMFDVWMRILRQVPEAVLWLLHGNETAKKHLRQEADDRGVNPKRIIFADRLPKDKHLARLRLADLALDTRIVNGHTTTSDVLWAGVPVITLMGSHFASRVSASILTAIGLPELITHSLEDYEALAVRLARDPEQLAAIRQKLATNRLTEPLFDTPRFVKNLEAAYKAMWKTFLAGEKPQKIEVVEK
jgi:protein O-GlcNAc transferase